MELIYYQNFDKILKGDGSQEKKLVLFGAGAGGVRTLSLYLKNYKVSYFCDNDPQKWGKIVMGLPVYPPDKLFEEDPRQVVVLITSFYFYDILRQLMDMNIPTVAMDIFSYPHHLLHPLWSKHAALSRSDKIKRLPSLLYDDESKDILSKLLHKYKTGNEDFSDIYNRNQYFNNVLADRMGEEEIYVDGGLFDGGTIFDFIKYSNGKFLKIYGFEPDPNNYRNVVGKFSDSPDKIFIYNSALSDYSGEIRFTIAPEISYASSISEAGNQVVSAVRLDDIADERISFIKLDVEGAEFDVLMGAMRTIQKYKPKLAISVYHRDDDLLTIPFLIHNMVPEYRLFLRHHSTRVTETVLYAKI